MKKLQPRLCVVRHGYFPDDIRVLKEVKALCEAGYSVDVICLKKQNEKYYEILENVHIYRIPLTHRRGSLLKYTFEYSLSFILMFILLTVKYFHRRYDCFQVNTLPDFLVFITVIPKLFGAKILIDLHEPVPELWITKYGENRFKRL